MKRFKAQTLRAFVPDVDRAYENCLVYEDVFSARQCDRIVAHGESLAVEEGLVGVTDEGSDANAEVRRARVSWVVPGDDTLWLLDKLTTVAQRANRTYQYDLLGFTEELQLTRYDEPGAFYGWHQDGLEGDLAGRKLSMVVQLTDPDAYVGSELEVFAVNEEYTEESRNHWRARARKRGSVVVFPAFEYHRVTPLESGVRYSLVAWLGGPPFR